MSAEREPITGSGSRVPAGLPLVRGSWGLAPGAQSSFAFAQPDELANFYLKHVL